MVLFDSSAFFAEWMTREWPHMLHYSTGLFPSRTIWWYLREHSRQMAELHEKLSWGSRAWALPHWTIRISLVYRWHERHW